MNELRTGVVYVQNRYAGRLCETDEGYLFTYDQQYLHSQDAVPVSLTLPLREESYFSATLFPFFDGLIPEGWLLEVVKQNWKISEKDRFGLLLVTGRDCIGDVMVKREDRA